MEAGFPNGVQGTYQSGSAFLRYNQGMQAPDHPWKIHELDQPEDCLFPQALSLLQASFSPDEIETPEQIAGHTRRCTPGSGFHFWVAEQDHTVLGVAIFTFYRPVRMGFIAYLAAHPQNRGVGMGSALLAHIKSQVAADSLLIMATPARGIFFEVDSPQAAQDDQETRIRLQRIHFYEKNDARLIPGSDYAAPPLRQGLAEVRYRLMYAPISCSLEQLTHGLRLEMMATLLREGYSLTSDSPYYRNAMASIK